MLLPHSYKEMTWCLPFNVYRDPTFSLASSSLVQGLPLGHGQLVPSNRASDKSTVVPNGHVPDKPPVECPSVILIGEWMYPCCTYGLLIVTFKVPTSCTMNKFHVVFALITLPMSAPWMIVVLAFLWVINILHDPHREIVYGNGPCSHAMSARLLLYSWAHDPLPCLPSLTKIGELSVEVVVNYAKCLGYGISLCIYCSCTTSYCSIIYYGCHAVISLPHPNHAPSEITTSLRTQYCPLYPYGV